MGIRDTAPNPAVAAMERLKAMKGEHHLKQSIERDDLGKLNSYTGVRPSSYRKSHQGACSSSRMSSPGVHSREPGIHRAVYSAGKPKSYREMQLTSRWQLSDARPDGSFSSYRKPLTKRGPNGKRVPVEAWNDLHGGTARARWGRQYSSPPKCGTVLEDEAMARPRIFVDYSSGRVAIERPDWSAGQLMEPWA